MDPLADRPGRDLDLVFAVEGVHHVPLRVALADQAQRIQHRSRRRMFPVPVQVGESPEASVAPVELPRPRLQLAHPRPHEVLPPAVRTADLRMVGRARRPAEPQWCRRQPRHRLGPGQQIIGISLVHRCRQHSEYGFEKKVGKVDDSMPRAC
jgi:hypothetical protein